MLRLLKNHHGDKMATCPHCRQQFLRLNLERVIGGVPFGVEQWNCMVYKCPNCDVAISVGIDMTAVRQDIIDHIQRRA